MYLHAGAKAITVSSKTGDVLLEVETAEEETRDQWVRACLRVWAGVPACVRVCVFACVRVCVCELGAEAYSRRCPCPNTICYTTPLPSPLPSLSPLRLWP
jgi:hypothetical protein